MPEPITVGAAAAGAGLGGCFSFLATNKTVKQLQARVAAMGSEADVLRAKIAKPAARTGGRDSTPTERRGQREGPCLDPNAKIRDEPVPADAVHEMQEERFLDLLRQLIGFTEQLQNNPRLGQVPQESLAAERVTNFLKPYDKKSKFSLPGKSVLNIEWLEFQPDRVNLKITYLGKGGTQSAGAPLSFVGSHFDVVPANPEAWERNPFELKREGDKLYGRGTTDCLGHVALLAEFMAQLAERQPTLTRDVVVVFIAGEEGGEEGVGIDALVENGHLASCQNGPIYWVDAADTQPCAGTSGTVQWTLTAKGRAFHSGLPHRGINSIELARATLDVLQGRFYSRFGPMYEEQRWGYAVASTFKPTQCECMPGGLNVIPGWCKMAGDIRLTPFHDVVECMTEVRGWVTEINQYLETKRRHLNDPANAPAPAADLVEGFGPHSPFVLPDSFEADCHLGTVDIDWGLKDPKHARLYEGIACDLASVSHRALTQAVRDVTGSVRPYSITGSLPLVRFLQREGFEISLVGFGLMSTYHANNEYCRLSDMKTAFKILWNIVGLC